MDASLIDIMVDADIAGMGVWGVMVADDMTDVMCQLVESRLYVKYPEREMDLLFWPLVEGVGQVPAAPSARWRMALNGKLQASRSEHRARFPYQCLTREQYEEVLRLAVQAENYLTAFRAIHRGAELGRLLPEAIYAPEVDGKYKFLETLPQLALIELMATVLLSQDREQVEWSDLLGEAALNLLRYPSKPAEFVGHQSDLPKHLRAGLKLLQERPE